jgi:predicted XRE-type DNA-binding protein
MKKSSAAELAKALNIAPARAMESTMKAQLIGAVRKHIARTGLTQADLADRSGLPRSAVTGILSGRLQKVTIDRVLRLVEAADLTVNVSVKATV